jgi:hypothetical protein
MEQIPATEAERAMKVQEVILRAMAKKISWWQAAEILGISERTMRRWKFGYAWISGTIRQAKGQAELEKGASGRSRTGAGPVSG